MTSESETFSDVSEYFHYFFVINKSNLGCFCFNFVTLVDDDEEMFNYYSIIWIIRIFLYIRIQICIFLPKSQIFGF